MVYHQAQKGAADAKRGKLFTKIIKQISVAANPAAEILKRILNFETIIMKAKAANMPRTTSSEPSKGHRGAGRG
jgi:transcriptional/translational regulatory protein YebC/TACO1